MEILINAIFGVLGTILGAIATKLTEKKIEKFTESKLFIATIEDIHNWGWDSKKLLRHLIAIDYETIPNLDENNAGNVNQWAPIFLKSTDCWRLLCLQKKEIVGYYSFFAMKDEFEIKMRTGNLLEKDIIEENVIDINDFDNKSISYFISMVGIRENYREKGFKLLIDAFVENLFILESKGKSIKDFYAYALTEEGRILCKLLNFKEFTTEGIHASIYVATYENLASSKLLKERIIKKTKNF